MRSGHLMLPLKNGKGSGKEISLKPEEDTGFMQKPSVSGKSPCKILRETTSSHPREVSPVFRRAKKGRVGDWIERPGN